MARYCEYCGQLIETGARYCTSCGAPVSVSVQEETVSEQEPVIAPGSGDYTVTLISLGTCAQAAAADLLEDTLGYEESEAEDLFRLLPAQIAQQLTRQQAGYLAQAMTEYGMEVSVSNGSEYVTVEETADTESVFDKGGSFLGKVLAVLGTITGLNRMRKFRRLDDPRVYAKPYRPKAYRPVPPVHVKRRVRVTSVQQPRPQQHVQPQPQRPQQHAQPQRPQQHTQAQQPHPQQHAQPQQPGHQSGPAGRQGGSRPGSGGRPGEGGPGSHRR